VRQSGSYVDRNHPQVDIEKTQTSRQGLHAHGPSDVRPTTGFQHITLEQRYTRMAGVI
jgi:hypothetical protein